MKWGMGERVGNVFVLYKPIGEPYFVNVRICFQSVGTILLASTREIFFYENYLLGHGLRGPGGLAETAQQTFETALRRLIETVAAASAQTRLVVVKLARRTPLLAIGRRPGARGYGYALAARDRRAHRTLQLAGFALVRADRAGRASFRLLLEVTSHRTRHCNGRRTGDLGRFGNEFTRVCLTAIGRHDHFADGTRVIGFQVQRSRVRYGVGQYVVHVELIFFQYELLQQTLNVRPLVRVAVHHGIATKTKIMLVAREYILRGGEGFVSTNTSTTHLMAGNDICTEYVSLACLFSLEKLV